MVNSCVVQNCKNSGTHRFPKNEARRFQWIQAVTYLKPGLSIKHYSLICSAHFKQTDFKFTPGVLKKLDQAPKILKRDAVPSVFPWNQSAQDHRLKSQEQSSTETIALDKMKIQKTYSKIPPIQFVELQPILDPNKENNIGHAIDLEPVFDTNLQEEEKIEDPLQIPDQDSLEFSDAKHILESCPDSIIEIEIGMKSVATQTPEGSNIPPATVTMENQTEVSSTTPSFNILNYKDCDKDFHLYTCLENF